MIETDAVVIGAGPVGLFQVFELGLLEIKVHVIDSLPAVGGQCVELYPDKPIYDIPAIKTTTGRELVDRLMAQIAPFDAQFHLGHEVSSLQRQADGRFAIETNRGLRLLTRTVHIAAGVGAFQPRRLKLDGIEAFAERQLFHRLPDAAQLTGRQVLVIGADDAALDAALSLVDVARVTLMHRRDAFSAAADRVAAMRAACARGAMRLVVGQAIGLEQADGRLAGLKIVGADNQTSLLAADAVLVFLGLSPKLGPVADWGLALERKQLVVDTERFQTSEPGIFAVGDINTYPGKRKLIVSGFHEATLAAFGAARHVFPDKPVLLQYTTTSPRLHQLLGVASTPPAADDH